VVGKRPWPAYLDGDWAYTNIYGAGISVDLIATFRGRLKKYVESGAKRFINYMYPHKFLERISRGESIYSDSNEDISYRYIEDEEKMADVEWREEDTPESHLIHCIYRTLEKEGYDSHAPICGIKLEANLYKKTTVREV